MALSSRGMPLAVLVPGCDESPTAYTDATQSSGRTGMSSKPRTGMASKQSTSAQSTSAADEPDREATLQRANLNRVSNGDGNLTKSPEVRQSRHSLMAARPHNRASNFVAHSSTERAELKYHEALAPIRPVFRTAMPDSPPAIT